MKVVKMMGMRSALVVGATGLVGSALVKLLCDSEEYVAVNVIARRPLEFSHPKLDVKIREFEHIAEIDIEFAHEVFCCLGTTIKKAGSRWEFEKVDVEYPLFIAALAKNQGIGHFIVISAMGASEKSVAYYNRVKGKLESQLIAMDFPNLSIVRPSLLTGDREEFRFSEKLGEWVMKGIGPLMVGPSKKYRTISAEQVAHAMKVIALHGKKQKVAIYQSDELATLQMPVPVKEEVSEQGALFNWDKYKVDELSKVDEQVVFNRENRKEQIPLLDEEVVFDRSKRKGIEVDLGDK